MNTEEWLSRVRQTVLTGEPQAKIYLYGSRARGDAADDSDWDFLILLEGPVDSHREDRVPHAIFEVELDTSQVLSSIIMSAQEWYSSRRRATPLYQAVKREGTQLRTMTSSKS